MNICKEFPGRKWNVRTVNRLIDKIVSTRKPGSGRPGTARTQENIAVVENDGQSIKHIFG